MGTEGPEQPNRRNFLGKLGAAALTSVVATGGLYGTNELLGRKRESKDAVQEDINIERPLREHFDLAEITGLPNTGLTKWYTGAEGPHLPGELSISFTDNLAAMWNEKIAALPATVDDDEAKMIGDFGNARATEYEKLWKKGPEAVGVPDIPQGLTEYPYFTHLVNEFSKVERELLENLDWDALAHEYGFSKENNWYINMLGHLAAEAHGRSLMAYSMTEIMPFGGKESENNILLYNFLLRTAGPKFINSIPALFDPQISFGPFQFTKFAVEEGITDPRNKYSVNKFLPESLRVPQHLKKFPDKRPGRELRNHAAAAFLFGLQNVATATRLLMDEGNMPALNAIADMDGGTFAALLAMHHHRPAVAREALLAWAKGVAAGDTDKQYYAYAIPEVASYGERSSNNFNAIETYFDSQSKT